MEYSDFYRKNFLDLCSYEDYLFKIDLIGKEYDDRKILNSLPLCGNHRFIIADGKVVWIGNDGLKVENPRIDKIEEDAFLNCSELTSMDVPDGVTIIGRAAFYGCDRLTSVTIPTSVKRIGMSAFYECTNLNNIMIPDGVESIGGGAFYHCANLTSMSIPSSVKCIGYHAFHVTPFYDNHPDDMVILGNVLYAYKGKSPNRIVIPDGVKSISDFAFHECFALESVSFPPDVARIGYNAFCKCARLKSVKIPRKCLIMNNTFDCDCEVIRY